MTNAARPSEFDLKPTEWKLPCGCYVENGRLTGHAFLCDKGHRLQDKVNVESAINGAERVEE